MNVGTSAAPWRKSTRSVNCNACVEFAVFDHAVGLRDSKDPHGPALVFSYSAWESFVEGLKDGDFDSV